MSRSDKRVTARYEQLEPVTLNMLSATAVASLYRNVKTIHRIVLSATDNSRVPLLRYGVTGERTVQRCRQKQKDRTSCDLFVWRLKQRFPWQGKCHGVTKGWLRGTSSSNLWLWICCRQLPLPHCIATSKQFTGLFWLRQKHSRLARLERFAILLVSSFSMDQLFVRRTVDPSRQLTAAFRYCNTVSQVRKLCRGAGRNKKDRTSCDLLNWLTILYFFWKKHNTKLEQRTNYFVEIQYRWKNKHK